MSLFKFSLFCLLYISSAHAFNDMDCLNSSYEAKVTHKGQPFGLTKNILDIKKEECVLTIAHEKYKFIKKKWNVDVCREPVHIKKGVGAVEVIKRQGDCPEGATAGFCGELHSIRSIIQDDGLIFAEGEKEDIGTDHGRVYCAYLLINAYLGRGLVFNRNQQYDGVLAGGPVTRPAAPAPVPSAAPSSGAMPAGPESSVEEEASQPSSTGSF